MQQPKQELAEAESRYRCLRAAVADYHYHVRIEGGRVVEKIHEANCEVVTGYRPEEYAANPRLWSEIVVDDDRSLVEQQTAQVLADQQAPTIEYRIRRKDGQLRWILKTVVPYHDAQGRVNAYDSLLHDFTEAKEAAEALRQSEERFRLLFEDDLTGNYLAAPDGTILLCNPAFVQIFGFSSREEAVGSNLANLYIAPFSWPCFIQLLSDNKTIERYERTVRHSDGTVRHVIETVLGTFNAQGELLRIKGYVFDDTDSKLAAMRMQRRNAELEEVVSQRTQALREKHEHLEAIWNSAFDAIITIDSQGMIETINRAAEKMFGYSKAEMIGQNVKMLMPVPFREEHDGYLRHYRETGQARILNMPRELIARRKDGSTFPIDLSVTQVDHAGYFTGIIRDTSERKELQKHVLEISAEEQRRIGRELHDGIQQELTAVSLMAGTLLELLNTAPLKGTADEDAWLINKTRFKKLCETSMKLSQRLSETNQHVRHLAHGIMPVQVDADGLRDALDELANSINGLQGVTCRFVCAEPIIVENNTASTHLYRIAQEAVNNAVRHGRPNEIQISLKQLDGELRLEVHDNGSGFDRLTAQKTQNLGVRGMGLQIMEYRAGLIGGTLQVERNATGGTSVKCAVVRSGSLS